MCGNRVEELEARVQELEASVEGLTDELVECKVRIRELEDIVDENTGFSPDEVGRSAGEELDAGVDESESPEESGAADTSKTEAPDEADNAESESEGTDIIIA